MKTAVLFPGQGSQQKAMYDPFRGTKPFEDIKRLLEDELREDIDAYIENFSSTRHVQLALLVVGVSSAYELLESDIVIDAVAGHSAGAFAAAVMANVITLKDAIHLVQLRGTLMEQAFPTGYGMIAVQGLDLNFVRELIEREEHVFLANENAHEQVVLSGKRNALDAISSVLKQKGARRITNLSVTVPSHSPLFSDVADTLLERFKTLRTSPPKYPFVANQTGKLLRQEKGIVEDLASNIRSTVRWQRGMRMLIERGVQNFIQVPPGSVYTNLLKHEQGGIQALSLETIGLRDIQSLINTQR
ncbi:ACP S-malonyltransferase [Geomicrobium sp. JSM 1781026]|uniref:ACP S-malonyltransferase n=1 Tax=Geomicrobium sp. JSM 1781026 TaxID=3344580 RepID=UPI0035C080C1